MGNNTHRSLRLHDIAAYAEITGCIINILALLFGASMAVVLGLWLGLLPKIQYEISWQQQFDSKFLTIVQFRNAGRIGTGPVNIRISLPGAKILDYKKGDDFGGNKEQTNRCEPDSICVSLPGLPAGSTRTVMIESSELVLPAIAGTFFNNLGVAQEIVQADTRARMGVVPLAYMILTSASGAFVLFRELLKAICVFFLQREKKAPGQNSCLGA